MDDNADANRRRSLFRQILPGSGSHPNYEKIKGPSANRIPSASMFLKMPRSLALYKRDAARASHKLHCAKPYCKVPDAMYTDEDRANGIAIPSTADKVRPTPCASPLASPSAPCSPRHVHAAACSQV